MQFFITQQNFIKALVCVCMVSGRLNAMELSKQKTDDEKQSIIKMFIEKKGNMPGEDLSGLDLRQAMKILDKKSCLDWNFNLNGANVSNSNFSGTDLRYLKFEKANCSGTDFSDAILMHTRFTEANLCGAYVNGSNMTRTDLEKADLCGIKGLATAYTYRTNFFKLKCFRDDLRDVSHGGYTDDEYLLLEDAKKEAITTDFIDYFCLEIVEK